MCEALIAGGIQAIEITMTTPNALTAIGQARQTAGKRCLIGAGTVIDIPCCRAAMEAGAEFIVTPICKTDLVKIAHASERPIMMGAFSPTEAQMAHKAGADFIKIFPADSLGPAFVKALLAPLPHLRLVPTGGVDVKNVGEFLRAGCAAVGVGSGLVSSKILEKEDWTELRRRAEEFLSMAQAPARS